MPLSLKDSYVIISISTAMVVTVFDTLKEKCYEWKDT